MRALLLLLLCAPALAQTAYPFTTPSCVPESLGGTGKGIAAIDVAEGTCRGYWCPAPTGWKGWSHCVLQAYKTPSINAALNTAVTATNPVAGLAGFVTATQVVPKTSDVVAYNALHDKMQKALLLTKPGAPAWATPAQGTFTIYTTAAGKLATIVSGRKASANQPCDCVANQVVSGASTYCALTGAAAAEVSLCKAVTP